MKLKINKDELLKSIEVVIKSVDLSNIYIHLRNLYVEVLDEMIIIKGSNGYFSIESKIESNKIISIEKIGSFLVPASLFINAIKKCEGQLEIESDEKILKIKNNSDYIEMNLIDVNEYPIIDFSLYGNKIKVNAEKLRRAIDNVIFDSSQTNEEIILSGINLKYNAGSLYITATDNFRLGREIIKINDDRNISFDITITNKNIRNLIPQNIIEDVTMYVNEHKINIIYKNFNFQSKIIDAPYKNVEPIFEKKFDKVLEIKKTNLSNAISKATVVSSNEHNKIYIAINENEIVLSTSAEEIGKTKVVIPKEEFEFRSNESINIVLNYKYLKEAINVFNDKITISFINSQGPIRISSEENSNVQIVSPMIA